jgi:hypothetical protein
MLLLAAALSTQNPHNARKQTAQSTQDEWGIVVRKCASGMLDREGYWMGFRTAESPHDNRTMPANFMELGTS